MRAPLGTPPRVFVAESQFDLLFNLAVGAQTPPARLLLDELERSVIVDDATPDRSFARLGDAVRYRDLTTRRERVATLVIPEDSNIDEGRLSVLTPAGAALIGLEPGAVLDWAEPGGRRYTLEVLEVVRS